MAAYIRELSGDDLGKVVRFMWQGPPKSPHDSPPPKALVVGRLERVTAQRTGGYVLSVSSLLPNPADFQGYWDYENVSADERCSVTYYNARETLERLLSRDELKEGHR